jgi:hypothetical protein
MSIPTLTLTQPWATLVAIGAKRIETRSWRTSYRGPLAIHAAKSFPQECKDLVWTKPFYEALIQRDVPAGDDHPYFEQGAKRDIFPAIPVGVVVAVCRLVDVVPTEWLVTRSEPISAQERALGNYSHGRFGWLLEDIRPLREPIPAKGALGLWQWQPPADLEELLAPMKDARHAE